MEDDDLFSRKTEREAWGGGMRMDTATEQQCKWSLVPRALTVTEKSIAQSEFEM